MSNVANHRVYQVTPKGIRAVDVRTYEYNRDPSLFRSLHFARLSQPLPAVPRAAPRTAVGVPRVQEPIQ